MPYITSKIHIAFFSLILLSLFNTFLSAQNSSIRGFVYDKENGEPIVFCNAFLKKTNYGSTSNENGFFSINSIKPGNYELYISFMGYDTIKESITLKENQTLSNKYYLNKSVINLKTVMISAEKEAARNEVKTSITKVTPKQITQIPSIGGQADIAQYLSVLPGVIFTGDQGGQLYIRGGAPIQNKVLLDGMIVYNPFHSIGLFSVLDMDIIRTADIYTGGFNAEYGGRISSIMDIKTRDGNFNRINGKIGANPFGSKITLEGPIKKNKSNKNNYTTFILSAKNSYLENTSKYFYPYADSNGLPFNYTDLYGKITVNAENGNKISFFGFNFADNVNYSNISQFKWNNAGMGTNFIIIPGNNPVLLEGNIAYSSYTTELNELNETPRTSKISGLNMNLTFNYFYGKNTLAYGFDLLGFKTDFFFFNELNRKIEQLDNTTEIAGFIKYKIVKNKFIIEPGFRLHNYASLSNISPEPRIGAKYIINDKLRLKTSGGLYSQNLISSSSDKDVINLFNGFLSGPENLPKEFNNKEITHKLQKATHAILGFEYDILPFIELNVEGYYKIFNQLTNINRNKIFEDNEANYAEPENLKKDFIIENGSAKGVDISLKYETERLYLWTAYSYGFINRYDGISTYYPHYDRRHNGNITGVYKLGKKKNWEIDARWSIGSGFPFTQTKGFYNNQTFTNGINTDYLLSNGSLGILYGEYNQARLPYYHRLDLSVKNTHHFKNKSTLETTLSITNVYNRKNIFYISRTNQKPIYQLPILPAIGVSYAF